ncbi:MAG: phosphoribosylglycinamide formyltransferase [Gemmatimonadaceae bacterium]|nr:phosphoribosylglycinamide formyltransferase [Gemmatimonadaceae bacterium]
MTARIAVLASGGGSNLQAILDHFAALADRAPGRVVLVASDRPNALALERGRRAGATAIALNEAARTAGLRDLLEAHAITHVALAGYLRQVPADVTTAWHGRMLNVHPALLPAFGGKGMYGHRVHEAVVACGVRVTGATVHFVDDQYDHGAVIAQWPVPVFPGDTAATVAVRVLEVEHQLFPPVVAAVAAGRITLDASGRVTGLRTPMLFAHFAASDASGAADAAPW